MVEYIEVRTRFTRVLRQVFDDDDLSITERMTLSDIIRVDELTLISLARALEREFSIVFSVPEIAAFDDVGAILRSVIAHIGCDEHAPTA